MADRYGRAGATGSSAGVSAEDVLAAVRVHADRVHDVVRRLGCDPRAAAEVVETSALDLVDAVAARPDTVPDPVGWWFARARALAVRVAARSPDLPLGGGVLSVDGDQEVLAEALGQLPEPERFVLLLRDSYDLPAGSVGAALGTDPAEALDRVGRARLALLPLLDEAPAPDVPAHQSSVGALARLGEGGPVAARDATARRHALSCDACRAVTDAQQRVHVLLTGLTVVALSEAERLGVLARVQSAAHAALPARAAHLLPGAGEGDEKVPRRSSSLLLVLLLPLLAGVLGVALGVLLSRSNESELVGAGTLPTDGQLISPAPPAPSATVSPPALEFPAPNTTVFVLPPPSPPPPPPPSPSPSAVPTRGPLEIAVDPAAGQNGQLVTVSGTGWTPGVEVLLDYVDPAGRPTGAQAVATADAAGRFTAELAALDTEQLPGLHVVRARQGELTAEATYDAQP